MVAGEPLADAGTEGGVNGPRAARLPDGRLRLTHGPIDLFVYAYGEDAVSEVAMGLAADAFVDVLPRLVTELPMLRRPVGAAPQGPVARRMHRACLPFAAETFVTPMAAVAGSVADHVLAAMADGAPLTKAYVNNGGDIAVLLRDDTVFDVGMMTERAEGIGRLRLRARDAIGGIATSGRGGRSHSLGIADSVTVLARNAAMADVAATLIANAVDVDDPAVARVPATELDPDSDLGGRLVTVSVGTLPPPARDAALAAGAKTANRFVAGGRIVAACMTLDGETRLVGDFRSHLAPREALA
jgi:ApbE superfamily uncharacterized protein (UPF0280 family)